MPNATGQDLKSRLAAELGRDKKKTVVLTIVMIIAVVLVYTKLIKKKTPKTAVAAEVSTVVAEPDMTATTPLVVVVDRDPVAAAYLKTLSRNIDQDLFQFKSEFFAPVVEELPEEPVVPEDLSQDPSPELTAAEKINWAAVIVKQAKDLRLDSLIVSEEPVAIINGTFVGVGDTIEGFVVVEIVSGKCIVSKRGIRIALRITE